MGDQKFQLRYSASEDRVLIISGTGADDMRCFALTRRMVGQLWPGMNKVISAISPRMRQIGADAPPAAPPPAAAGPAAGNAAPGAGPAALPVPQPDLPADNPFGAPPPARERHLVRKLQLIDHGGNTRQLVLTAAGTELRVPLDSQQLIQIYEALRVVIERADWGIDLDAGLPAAATASQPPLDTNIDITSESPSRYRH